MGQGITTRFMRHKPTGNLVFPQPGAGYESLIEEVSSARDMADDTLRRMGMSIRRGRELPPFIQYPTKIAHDFIALGGKLPLLQEPDAEKLKMKYIGDVCRVTFPCLNAQLLRQLHADGYGADALCILANYVIEKCDAGDPSLDLQLLLFYTHFYADVSPLSQARLGVTDKLRLFGGSVDAKLLYLHSEANQMEVVTAYLSATEEECHRFLQEHLRGISYLIQPYKAFAYKESAMCFDEDGKCLYREGKRISRNFPQFYPAFADEIFCEYRRRKLQLLISDD